VTYRFLTVFSGKLFRTARPDSDAAPEQGFLGFMHRLFARVFELSRPIKRLIQVSADLVLIASSFALAMALRLGDLSFVGDLRLWAAVGASAVATIMTFEALGLYRTMVRFVSAEVLRIIIAGVSAATVTLFLAAFLLDAPLPQTAPGIYAALLMLSTGGARFIIRLMFRRPDRNARRPVIVYGAGESGRQLVNALDHGHDYRPVAILDDDERLQGSMIAGRPVHAPDEAQALLKRTGAKTILLAMPSITRARRRELVSRLAPLGVEVKTIPGMTDLVSGRATVNELRRVSPDDLLGRDPVPARDDLMARNIDGKVVMVTGAGGSIGAELCRQIAARKPAMLVLVDASEYALYAIHTELRDLLARSGRAIRIEAVLGSVQDAARMSAVLRNHAVQTIFHAAAYKHVAMVERNAVEGLRNNVLGTRALVQVATQVGVGNFILISSDKAVRPTSVMGASKRLAELVCQAQAMAGGHTRISIVRFGNVLGSSGSVIPRFRSQIERGGPLTVTHPEITRYFMTVSEAAQLVIQAGAMARGGEVFVLDMGEPVRIMDLAHTMIRLHGLNPYVLAPGQLPDPRRGDIAIRIVGLGAGEKLFEETLIGAEPRQTDHPRILAATEHALTPHDIAPILARLESACRSFDLQAIERLLKEAPLDYRPSMIRMRDTRDLDDTGADASAEDDDLRREVLGERQVIPIAPSRAV
jgi:FlaA1/EpsC-like NDP-sugar epimerase